MSVRREEILKPDRGKGEDVSEQRIIDNDYEMLKRCDGLSKARARQLFKGRMANEQVRYRNIFVDEVGVCILLWLRQPLCGDFRNLTLLLSRF